MSGLVITALLFPLAGCLLGRRPLAEAFLLGLGIVGGSLFVLGVLHVPFVISLTLVGLGSASRWLAGAPPARRPADQPAGSPAVLVTVTPLVLLAIAAAIIPLHDFDGRAFWLLKAKALAEERRVDGPFFRGASVYDPRNQYPLLMPLDAAAVMIIAGDTDDRQARWLYLFTFVALVFHLRRQLARFVRPETAAWCAALFAWTPQFAVSGEGGALSAYSDMAIAAFVACAFFELLERQSAFRFGMWLSFLTLTKNEGLPIALLLLAIGAVSYRRRIGWSILPLAVAVTALFSWRSGIPVTDEENFLSRLPLLPSRLGQLIPAIAAFGKHFFLLSTWGLVWIVALTALMVLAWRKEWRPAAVVGSVSAVYITAYAITQWWTPDALAGASADRLLMHMIGPAIFAIARITDGSGQNRYIPPEYRPR